MKGIQNQIKLIALFKRIRAGGYGHSHNFCSLRKKNWMKGKIRKVKRIHAHKNMTMTENEHRKFKSQTLPQISLFFISLISVSTFISISFFIFYFKFFFLLFFNSILCTLRLKYENGTHKYKKKNGNDTGLHRWTHTPRLRWTTNGRSTKWSYNILGEKQFTLFTTRTKILINNIGSIFWTLTFRFISHNLQWQW